MKGPYGKMLKQFQKMQAEMGKIQDELAKEELEATAGGGMVKAVVNGQQQLVRIEIDPETLNPGDKEILEEMILAAVNEAMRLAQELATRRLGSLTGELGIPGL